MLMSSLSNPFLTVSSKGRFEVDAETVDILGICLAVDHKDAAETVFNRKDDILLDDLF